jgi:transforming growth factor-beta-induced protein
MTTNIFQKWISYSNVKALVILAIIAVTLVACSDDTTTEENMVAETSTAPQAEQTQEESKTIVDIAVEDGRFTTLVTALQATELDSVLAGEGPFTVFAPTDDAFGKLPEGTVASLLETTPALKNILLYHVVSGNVLAADVVTLESAVTLQGQTVSISVMGDVVKINDAQVIITDIQGSNGIIHVIDTVLLPAEEESKTIVDIAVEDGRFTTLVTALQATELDSVLAGEGPFTVFAPTDDAFGKLPEGTVASLLETTPALKNILLYHVVSGNVLAADVVTLESAVTLQGQTVSISVMGDVVNINDSQIIITDIQGSNGTIHVIDTVLSPAE